MHQISGYTTSLFDTETGVPEGEINEYLLAVALRKIHNMASERR